MDKKKLSALIRQGDLDSIKKAVSSKLSQAQAEALFIDAVQEGQLEIAKFFIDYKVNVNARDNEALFLAIEKQDLKAVEFLVSNGASLKKPKRRTSPLAAAVKTGNKEILKRLISLKADDLNEAFFESIKRQFFDLADYLLENGADIDYADGRPIFWAATYGRTEALEYLMKKGAKLDFPSKRTSILLEAARSQQFEALRLLLSSNPELSRINDELLLEFAYRKQFAFVKELVSEKKLFLDDQIAETLRAAIENNNREAVEYILSEKIPFYVHEPWKAPLVCAARQKNAEITQILLDSDLEGVFDHIETALKTAAKLGAVEVLEKLLERKDFEVSLMNEALLAASESRHFEAAVLLVKNGADPDILQTSNKNRVFEELGRLEGARAKKRCRL